MWRHRASLLLEVLERLPRLPRGAVSASDVQATKPREEWDNDEAVAEMRRLCADAIAALDA